MTPLAQAKNIFDDIVRKITEYFTELLESNGNRIALGKEILMRARHATASDPTESYAPFYVEEVRLENGKIFVYQSHEGQGIEFPSTFDILEMQTLVLEAAQKAEREAKTEFFPITSAAREDVENAGFNAKHVSNEDMQKLASKMADAYIGNGFWQDIKIIAEHLGFSQDNRYVMGWSQADSASIVVYAKSLEEAQELFENGDYELEQPDDYDWLCHAHEVLDERFPDADEGIKDDFACEHWQNGLSDKRNCDSFGEYYESRQES